ncbi:hypothetical protein KPL37_13970 [Clostridium frigoris]|uniref:Uncharacterized protein n=1 Tax=Clostridium frigoris TaxID=205327 RepID=A0ABS6BVA7_9CLOT|nr:hypothetical protein [Clostridium frigoris]MBU3160849.1 hypothetical protein [Clostridium frigoris]
MRSGVEKIHWYCFHKKTSVVSTKLILAVNKMGSANIDTGDMELLVKEAEVAKILPVDIVL